jgi:NAD(P)-dependent dehydrogenase (short-subunit alcohol dehydrogenase family)
VSALGGDVALSDVDIDGLDETVTMCATGLGRVGAYRLDVADRDAMFEHAERVAADFGRVDVVVNNAGVGLAATVEEMTFADLDWLIGINLFGVINGSMAFLPHLIASGAGHLVNISSVFGLVGVPTQSAYCTAKFAVRGFTESLRQEMLIAGRPVGVHCVHPGGIRTNIARNARITGSVPARGDPAQAFERFARTSPDRAARVILAGVAAGKPRILVGPDAYLIEAAARVLGHRYQRLVSRVGRRLTA